MRHNYRLSGKWLCELPFEPCAVLRMNTDRIDGVERAAVVLPQPDKTIVVHRLSRFKHCAPTASGTKEEVIRPECAAEKTYTIDCGVIAVQVMDIHMLPAFLSDFFFGLFQRSAVVFMVARHIYHRQSGKRLGGPFNSAAAFVDIASQYYRIRSADGWVDARRALAPQIKMKIGENEQSHWFFPIMFPVLFSISPGL
jgi:hypothetical protein